MDDHKCDLILTPALSIYLDNFKHDFRVARQLTQMHEKAGNMDAYQLADQLSEAIHKTSAVTAKAAKAG